MIIVCDIDNTINNLTEQALLLYNAQTNKNIQMSNITAYNFSECLPQEDAEGICALFKDKQLWDSLRPLPESQKTLQKLVKSGHAVYMATATAPINFEWKCEWMCKFFGFIPMDNIIRIVDKSLIKADVMIDDYQDNLIGNICERIILDYPYNRDIRRDFVYDLHRIYRWNEVENIINDIERKNKEWEK